MAISGFNFAIVAGLFVAFFGWLLGRWKGMLAAQIGRQQYGLNSLAFVAALMALADPHVLWDVGFQLSFAATLGLVLYGAPSQAAVASVAGRVLPPSSAQRLASLVSEYFLFTLAAQLTTLPVIAYHFGRVSLSALLANPLILPVQPAVMVVGGLGVLLGAVFQPGGQVIAYITWPFVAYTIRMVELLARLPGDGLVIWNTSVGGVIAFYALLFGGTLALARLGPVDMRRLLSKVRPSLVVFGLVVANVLIWRMAWSAPDGKLHLTVLDVSTASLSGEAVLIQTPGGRYI